jgi:membrane protein DedA with SNARE-associated domain
VVARIGAGVLAVAFVLLTAYRVRQRNWPRAALAAAVAALLLTYALGALPAAPDGREAVEDSADSLGASIYPFIAGVALLESFPPPFSALWPGEFGVIFAGAIAAEGEARIVPLIAIVWVASAVADSAAFGFGRRFGREWLEHHGARVRVTPQRLARLDGWYDRWGTGIVVFGRLLPIARPLGPFVAGTSAMPYHRFLRWNLVGVTLFALGFSLLGYVFYESYDDLVVVIGRAGLAAVALALVVAFVLARRRRAI